MNQLLFIALLFIVQYTLIPILKVASLFFRFIAPKLSERIEFEKRNMTDSSSISFKEKGIKALVCFEISSEGELEQIKPLLSYLLDEIKQPVELIYCSPSVEEHASKLVPISSKAFEVLPPFIFYLG